MNLEPASYEGFVSGDRCYLMRWDFAEPVSRV
jgi:hypothetical protein